jgi:hypothetical protein
VESNEMPGDVRVDELGDVRVDELILAIIKNRELSPGEVVEWASKTVHKRIISLVNQGILNVTLNWKLKVAKIENTDNRVKRSDR